MKTSQVIKDKILGFLDYLFRLVMINVLIIVPSFSFIFIYSYFDNIENNIWLYLTLIPIILYLIPAIVAGFACIKMYEDNGSTGIFKEFFQFLKKYYKKSILFSLVFSLAAILLANSIFYFYDQMSYGVINVIGFFLSISVALILIFMVIHIPLTIVYFEDLQLKECLKISMLMTFKNIWKTLLMFVCLIVFIILDSFVLYFMAFLGFSLPIYILVKLSFKQYITIYRKL